MSFSLNSVNGFGNVQRFLNESNNSRRASLDTMNFDMLQADLGIYGNDSFERISVPAKAKEEAAPVDEKTALHELYSRLKRDLLPFAEKLTSDAKKYIFEKQIDLTETLEDGSPRYICIPQTMITKDAKDNVGEYYQIFDMANGGASMQSNGTTTTYTNAKGETIVKTYFLSANEDGTYTINHKVYNQTLGTEEDFSSVHKDSASLSKDGITINNKKYGSYLEYYKEHPQLLKRLDQRTRFLIGADDYVSELEQRALLRNNVDMDRINFTPSAAPKNFDAGLIKAFGRNIR